MDWAVLAAAVLACGIAAAHSYLGERYTWCRSTPEEARVLASSDGTLHVRVWEGEGDGLTVR